MSAATQDPAVTVPDETTGYFVIGSTLPDPTVNLLKRLMHQESTVLDWTVDLRVVGSEIWIWDDRADRHVRMTEEELSRICTGWEELIDELPRLRVPHSSSLQTPASWLVSYDHPACKAA